MENINIKVPCIFIRGSATNDCYEQPDAGKILPDKSENSSFSTSSDFFPETIPNPS